MSDETHDESLHRQSPMDRVLGRLALGEATAVANLAVVPVFDPEADPAPGYLTLDEALAEASLDVGEVSESGRVPELKVTNRGSRPVLLLDGEELVGAKQNRVLNISILVPEKATLVVPVSCVEQGRWAYRSRGFESRGRAQYARGRAEKMATVSASMRGARGRTADQGAVWASVAHKAANFDVHSDTGSMEDIYEALKEKLDRFRTEIRRPEGAAGGLFCIDGRVAGVELFDSPATFRRVFSKLLESYAVDALESSVDENGDVALDREYSVSEHECRRFMRWIGEARRERFDALGLGEDLRFESPRIVGAGLEAEGRLVHLSAFARQRSRAGRRDVGSGRMAAASTRRRRWYH